MTRRRPVAYLANFSADSTASVPLLQKNTRSRPGALASSRCASNPGSGPQSNWVQSARWASSASCSAWRITGWLRPAANTPKPARKSAYWWPSESYRYAPSARS